MKMQRGFRPLKWTAVASPPNALLSKRGGHWLLDVMVNANPAEEDIGEKWSSHDNM